MTKRAGRKIDAALKAKIALGVVGCGSGYFDTVRGSAERLGSIMGTGKHAAENDRSAPSG